MSVKCQNRLCSLIFLSAKLQQKIRSQRSICASVIDFESSMLTVELSMTLPYRSSDNGKIWLKLKK